MSQPSKEISSGEANSGTQQKADVHVNPMDTQPHEDIIEDMLESPQWNDGLAGILTPGRPLLATLSRSDQGWWVAQDYNLNEQQAFDIFYAFLCMRELYHMQHPNLCKRGKNSVNRVERPSMTLGLGLVQEESGPGFTVAS